MNGKSKKNLSLGISEAGGHSRDRTFFMVYSYEGDVSILTRFFGRSDKRKNYKTQYTP
jgi:hypothetical protein